MRHPLLRSILAAFTLGLSVIGVVSAQETTEIQIGSDALGVSGVAVDTARDSVIVGSITGGAVYFVNSDGTLTALIQDESLTSARALVIDAATNRLYVIDAGFGAGFDPSQMQLPEGFDPSQMQLPEGMTLPEGFDPSQMQLPEGFDPSQMQLPEGMTLPEGFDPSQIPAMNNTIALFVYDLASGDKVLNIDLTNVAPTGGRFPNGITLDAQGNAYISDGAAGVIYRVDTTGGTAFLTDTRFSDDAGQLSGVAYHPNGYLIVAKSDGSLFKIPLDNPSNVQPVTVTTPPTRITGLALLGDGRLAALDNSTDTIAVLSSADDWANATTSSTVPAPENTVSITADDTTVIALTGFGGGIMALAQNAGADASTETTPSTITRITIP